MKLRSFFYRLTHWEEWDYLAKYYPIVPMWLWYALKSRALFWFSPSNPTLTFGGFEGETKSEMYAQLPEHSYPKTIVIAPQMAIEKVLQSMIDSGLTFPIAAKPDVGMRGLMYRTIVNPEALRKYHEAMPADYLLQAWIDYPMELSVFYYRLPASTTGCITGVLRKHGMRVTGDGRSTLESLIVRHPRIRRWRLEMLSKHQHGLQRMPAKGETVQLSPALNLSRGGEFENMEHEKDAQLLTVFDALSRYSGGFYYGRYDLKCRCIADLKKGKNFSILEFNGCGAEPHHIYGNGNHIFEAYRILLHHWKMLYVISRYNYRNGVPYWSFLKGRAFLKVAKKHFALMEKLDRELEL